MISDVLFTAVTEIDEYLNGEVFSDVYGGPLRERIVKCRDEMDAIRKVLDTPSNVGRAEEDAGQGSPQGESKHE